MIPPQKKRISRCFIFIAVLFLFPFPVTVVPEWTVQVVNNKGEPIPNISVTEAWKNYSLERSDEHLMSRFTDQNGFVTFPRHRLIACVLRYTIVFILEFKDDAFNSSVGSFAYLMAGKENLNGLTYYWYKKQGHNQYRLGKDKPPY